MIDAYEIGIQLSLQDGVSAGLEVIARELAEVDRAVAASSAGLIALTRTAEGAAQAVAAAAGVAGTRAPLPVVPVADAPAPAAQVRNDGEGGAGPVATPPAAPVRQEVAEVPAARTIVREGGTVGAAVAAARRNDERSAPAAPAPLPSVRTEEAAPAFAPRERGVLPGSEVPRRAASVVAPAVMPVVRAPGRVDGPSASVIVEQNVAAAPQAAGRRDAGTGAAALVVAPVQVVSDVAGRPRAEASHPVAVRAAVAEATAGRSEAPRATGRRVVGGSAAVPERDAGPPAAAEWTVQVPAVTFAPGTPGPAATPTVPPASKVQNRAAAPQPAAQEREQTGGGSVMLDGRLVGFWLTDRMAREASRPPGGTSFFDPRQAPAWTPSGAL